ncbi:MAG: class I SAM-dependent methyltransferase [Kofleriaceae bacterium]|nr:class I SAM-dependent methyltransferase [Kofleriaceae bacterium]MCL4223167.1 methyltransferase domain-containing protein [Myxococcales bacterium]
MASTALVIAPGPVLELLATPSFAEAVGRRAGASTATVVSRLADIRSEAELALRLLESLGPIRVEDRILEVGAGAGVVAGILHASGARVVAIEPLIEGFDLFDSVAAELAASYPPAAVPLVRKAARDLTVADDGAFDLIFSVNVLEHCHPLDESLDALAGVLAPGGRMLHTCPNYRIPYEPHYAIPLIPGLPALTRFLLPRIRDEALWKSLNFITAGDVARFAHRNGLELRFRPGVLTETLDRLTVDPAFVRRQGWTGRAALAMHRLGAGRVLDAVPPTWVTPMVLEARRPG